MVKNYRPGPAKYTLPPTIGFIGQDLRKIRLPAYSFGLRLRNYHDIVGPAPNEYVLSSTIGGQDKVLEFFSNFLRKFSFIVCEISII